MHFDAFILILCAANFGFVFATFVIVVIMTMTVGRLNDLVLSIGVKRKVEDSFLEEEGEDKKDN